MATAKKTSRATSRKGGAGAKKKAQASGATQEIIGFALMVLGIFSFVAVVMGGAGLLGESIAGVMFGLFGLGAYVVPLLLLCIGWIVLIAKRMRLHPGKLALTSVTVLMLFVINHLVVDGRVQQTVLETRESVGYWGYIVGSYAYGQAHHVGSGALGGILTFPARAAGRRRVLDSDHRAHRRLRVRAGQALHALDRAEGQRGRRQHQPPRARERPHPQPGARPAPGDAPGRAGPHGPGRRRNRGG